MKPLVLIILICSVQLTLAQNVQFSNGAFDNGLIYPIAQHSGSPEAVKTLNDNILEIVSVYENQDYCIGQYGFVQHNRFVQLNFYFNCIDFDESKKESHLFSLESGEKCMPSEMFSETNEHYNDFIRKKITTHYSENAIEAPKEFISKLTIDDCHVNLLEKGFEISFEGREDWPDKNLIITWSELGPYLKHLRSR